MPKLVWDQVGERFYETGTDHGVLYPQTAQGTYPTGVAWNGLTAVTESPSGAEATDLWADNMKYASLRSAENFGCTIEAYTYPEEFAACDGSREATKGVYIGQQERQSFGFTYRTLIGNDTGTTTDDAYKLHLVYGCTASPSEKNYQTVNDSPEAITMSWEVDTSPVAITVLDNVKPTAHLVIDSRYADASKLKALEDVLYGGESSDAKLPLPDEVITMMQAA